MKVLSAATAMFRARPIHFHRLRQYPTLENNIRYKTEVETVYQTGSTNNLTTETDIDAISVAIPMFWGASLSLMYIPTSNDAIYLHPELPRWRTDTGSNYNFAIENDIKVLSAATATF